MVTDLCFLKVLWTSAIFQGPVIGQRTGCGSVARKAGEGTPAETDPIEWFLLTTVDIKSVDDALNCVKWYCLRWRIEDWHRVLKFGCEVENIAHKTAERLRRAIAINMVIAWRIMIMTLMGRQTPELPPEVVFSDLEIEVLKAYAKKKSSVPRIL